MTRVLKQAAIAASQEFPGRRETTIELWGALVSKKNKLRPRGRRGGGRAHMYDEATTAAIASFTTQARAQWGPRPPWIHPRYELTVYSSTELIDADGVSTTVLDCLKRAGVIFDDSIRYFNGGQFTRPAIMVPKGVERVLVRLISTD